MPGIDGGAMGKVVTRRGRAYSQFSRVALIGSAWLLAAISLAIVLLVARPRIATGWSEGGLLFVVLTSGFMYACAVSALRAQRIRSVDTTRWVRAVEPTREIVLSAVLLSALWLWAELASGDVATLLGDLVAGAASVLGIGSVLLVVGPGRLAQRKAEERELRYSWSAASPKSYVIATPQSTMVALGLLIALDILAVILFAQGFNIASLEGLVEVPTVVALVMFFSWAAAFATILCLGLIPVLRVASDQFERVEVLPRQFLILNTAMLVFCFGVLFVEPRAFQDVIQGARLSLAVVGGVMTLVLIGSHRTARVQARQRER